MTNARLEIRAGVEEDDDGGAAPGAGRRRGEKAKVGYH